MVTKLRQILCGLFGGHEDYTKREPFLIYDECLGCKRRTKGWKLA